MLLSSFPDCLQLCLAPHLFLFPHYLLYKLSQSSSVASSMHFFHSSVFFFVFLVFLCIVEASLSGILWIFVTCLSQGGLHYKQKINPHYWENIQQDVKHVHLWFLPQPHLQPYNVDFVGLETGLKEHVEGNSDTQVDNALMEEVAVYLNPFLTFIHHFGFS